MFFNSSKKKKPSVDLDSLTMRLVPKFEQDAILFLFDKLDDYHQVIRNYDKNDMTVEQSSIFHVVRNLCLDDLTMFTFCYTKNVDLNPVYVIAASKYNKRLLLAEPWEDENPFIQILELMPYIIYINKYFLYDEEPGMYPDYAMDINSVMMSNLLLYYNACIEYVLKKITDHRLVNKNLAPVLTAYDKEYLDQYCNIYASSFTKKRQEVSHD